VGAEEDICFKVSRGKRGFAKNMQRRRTGSVKRIKYSSSEEIEQRLAHQ
jgi:hypothetical protein